MLAGAIGRELQPFREIDVEGHERSPGGDCSVEHLGVRRPRELLIMDSVDVVTGIAKFVTPVTAEVLVGLEPHATSTKRPTARRAP